MKQYLILLILFLLLDYSIGYCQTGNSSYFINIKDSSMTVFLCYDYDNLDISENDRNLVEKFLQHNINIHPKFKIAIHATSTSSNYNNIGRLEERVKILKAQMVNMGVKRKLIKSAELDYDKDFYVNWNCNEIGLILFFIPR